MKNEIAIFLLAVQFLTRIPVTANGLYTPERFAATVRYYPLVGLIVGCLCGAVLWIATQFLNQWIAVLLAVSAGLLITGGFHEDGLADTFDGTGGVTRERTLEIMKDSRIGTYGALALVMALGLKIAALTTLPLHLATIGLVAGHALSRLSSVLVIATSRYVRDNGTGKPVAGEISGIGKLIAFGSGLVVLVIWLVFLPVSSIMFALAGLAIGHIFLRLVFERKLGGYTGDNLGAVQQSSEIGFYLGLVTWIT